MAIVIIACSDEGNGSTKGTSLVGTKWKLIGFYAPNTRYIGKHNFYYCGNLQEVYLPSVIEVE